MKIETNSGDTWGDRLRNLKKRKGKKKRASKFIA